MLASRTQNQRPTKAKEQFAKAVQLAPSSPEGSAAKKELQSLVAKE